jgi:hypothetical protein
VKRINAESRLANHDENVSVGVPELRRIGGKQTNESGT